MSKKNTVKKVKRKKWLRLSVTNILLAAVSAFFLTNFLFQISKKPTELLSLFFYKHAKSPSVTWQSYGDLFIQHSTDIMSADFLAAMAQVESSGNAYTSPQWQMNFEASIFDIYKPASSSVGLMQFTEGTFDLVTDYCIHNHRVKTTGDWYDLNSCWFNWSYTRLSASDSIEVTSAYLHASVEKLLKQKRRTANLKTKQTLAAAIHLCGYNKVKQSLRSRSLKVKGCGSHSLKKYVQRIRKNQKIFSRYLAREKNQESNKHVQQLAQQQGLVNSHHSPNR